MPTDCANHIAEIKRLRVQVEWASKRVDELEDLIADFFRGIVTAEELRLAVIR